VIPARFIEERRDAWDVLERLVKKAGRKGVAALSQDELHRLSRLYPAVAVDVSRARMYDLDPKTQRRINQLAVAAHGLLYTRARSRPGRAVWRFLRDDYPRLFRRLWHCVSLATAIFLVAGLATYASTLIRPSAAHLFVPGGLEMPDSEPGVTAEDISERFRQLPRPPLAAAVMANNVSVAFNAFALGITAGIGTCYVLLVNAMMLGGIAGHFANHGLSYPFWCFVTPHGVLEIMAIMIAAGAGLRMGLSLAIPGRLTRKASLRRGAAEAVLLVLGTIPMFIVAGAIEGFITPSHLPGGLKIVGGLVVGAAALAYLLLAGRGAPEPGVIRAAGST
jgi:uncharacterized membrane protein SpoIIM required for sporulation